MALGLRHLRLRAVASATILFGLVSGGLGLQSEYEIGPSNRRLMLGACCIFVGFAAYSWERSRDRHPYEDRFLDNGRPVLAVLIYSCAALFFGYALIYGSFPPVADWAQALIRQSIKLTRQLSRR
jgi:hypothetical protein